MHAKSFPSRTTLALHYLCAVLVCSTPEQCSSALMSWLTINFNTVFRSYYSSYTSILCTENGAPKRTWNDTREYFMCATKFTSNTFATCAHLLQDMLKGRSFIVHEPCRHYKFMMSLTNLIEIFIHAYPVKKDISFADVSDQGLTQNSI